MNSIYMTITPEVATTWLSTSKGNPRWGNGKKADPQRVATIANDIRQGNWNPGNNSIAFDEDGALVDGHHRLTAIVAAGIPVDSLVTFGVSSSGVSHIDENATRKVHQRIKVDTQAVSVANCHYWMCGDVRTAKSSEVIAKWTEEHPLVNSAIVICRKGGGGRAICRKAGVIHGTLCAMEYGVSEDVLANFFEIVNSGYAASEFDSPGIALRNMLLVSHPHDKRDTLALSYATQAAIKDYVDANPRRRVYRATTGYYFDELVKRGTPGYTKA